MPAITADTLTLPRLDKAGPADTERPVRTISTGPRGYEGEGFPVVRAFAGVSTAALDPFVHMDQIGEVEYQPGEPSGTDWHPHRGFETVTYMLDGRLAHQDSHGGGGLITDGATQWMTASSGILHIETPPAELVESGGIFHGIQLWVNLPKKDKFATPRYQAIEGNDVVHLDVLLESYKYPAERWIHLRTTNRSRPSRLCGCGSGSPKAPAPARPVSRWGSNSSSLPNAAGGRSTHPTWWPSSAREPNSKTANSSNDPTSQRVRIKPRNTPIRVRQGTCHQVI